MVKCIVCDVDGGGHMANCPERTGRAEPVQASCKFCNATTDLIPLDLEKVATRQFVCSQCEWDIDKSSRVFRGTVEAW